MTDKLDKAINEAKKENRYFITVTRLVEGRLEHDWFTNLFPYDDMSKTLEHLTEEVEEHIDSAQNREQKRKRIKQ